MSNTTVTDSPHGPPWILTPSQRDGVIFMAVIGSVSTLSLLILLVHIVSVSFLPLCLSALNLRGATTTGPHFSSTGNSNSMEVVSAGGGPDRKSNVVTARGTSTQDFDYSIDLERVRAQARTLDDRRARARARELSRQNSKNNEERMFLRMQLGVFIVCMLMSDLIQSSGVLIQARWAYLGRVDPGSACWVQGAMLTFGDVATAVWNAVIACHTFATVVLGVRMSTLGIAIVVICGWTIPVMMNVIGSVIIATPKKDYYDVAGAWCFISNPYYIERIVLHYVPLLFAALIITIMYTLVSLTMRGNLQVTPVSTRFRIPWFSVSFRRTTINRVGMSGNTNQKQVAYLRSLSLKMLWYPCVYICLILPISVCRMVEVQHRKAPFAFLFFAMTLLFLVGLSNVAIYVTTRNVGLHRKSPVVRSFTNPQHGTQVEIFVDRVTQHDIGVMTIGGSAIHGRDKAAIRFDDGEMDEVRAGTKKGEDDVSSQNSWDRDVHDAKSPNSATQFMQASPTYLTHNSPPDGLESQLRATPRHLNQAHTPSRSTSVGSIVVDRFGTLPSQDYDAPFQRSLAERPPISQNASPVSPFARSVSPTMPLHPYAASGRSTPYAWEQHQKSMRSMG